MIRYKLLTQDMMANGRTWKLNEWHETNLLYGPTSLRCDAHPLLAVLLNPNFGNNKNPRLFKCEVRGKCGENLCTPTETWTRMRITKEIPLPKISTKQRRRFALFCALEVYPLWRDYDKASKWGKWAKDPTREAAELRRSETDEVIDRLYKLSGKLGTSITPAAISAAAAVTAYTTTRITMKKVVANAAGWAHLAAKTTLDFIALAKQAIQENK